MTNQNKNKKMCCLATREPVNLNGPKLLISKPNPSIMNIEIAEIPFSIFIEMMGVLAIPLNYFNLI